MFASRFRCLFVAGLLSSGCAAEAGALDETSSSDTLVTTIDGATPGTITHLLGDERVLLGDTAVRGGAVDAIAVGGAEGLFSSLMLRVVGGSVALIDVKITFGNGDEYSPGTALVFNAGQGTRDIYVPGNRRFIRKVEFKGLEISGSPRIQLWGRTAETALTWENLGSTAVAGSGLEHDRLVVGSYRGPMRAVQIRVAGGDLVLSKIRITLTSGKVYEPHPRDVFRAGSRSLPLDLPGLASPIDFVEYDYATLSGHPRLALFGLKD